MFLTGRLALTTHLGNSVDMAAQELWVSSLLRATLGNSKGHRLELYVTPRESLRPVAADLGAYFSRALVDSFTFSVDNPPVTCTSFS